MQRQVPVVPTAQRWICSVKLTARISASHTVSQGFFKYICWNAAVIFSACLLFQHQGRFCCAQPDFSAGHVPAGFLSLQGEGGGGG